MLKISLNKIIYEYNIIIFSKQSMPEELTLFSYIFHNFIINAIIIIIIIIIMALNKVHKIKMGRSCSQERKLWEDEVVDGRTILKWTLKK